LLAGASRQDRPRSKRNLSALPIFYPGGDTWEKVERWRELGADTGERFTLPDPLIAAIAEENRSPLWTLDGDFERMSRLVPLDLYQPPTPALPPA
jgi:predicted nucleic acid-binding protein